MPSQLPAHPTLVSVDTETSGLHPDDGARVSCVAVVWRDPDGTIARHAWPFDQGERDKVTSAQLELGEDTADHNLGQDEWMCLLGWLATRSIVMQNALFDTRMLKAGTRHWPGIDLISNVTWDTSLATFHLDPRQPTSLESTTERHQIVGAQGGKSGEKDKVQSWLYRHRYRSKETKHRYDLVPWDVIETYVVEDAELTLLLAEQQIENWVPERDPWVARAIATDLVTMRTLYQIEQRGLAYDAEASLKVARKAKAQMRALAKTMPFQPTVDHAKTYFYKQAGATPTKFTESGAPSLDADAVRDLIADDVLYAEEWQQYTRLKNAVSRWYEGYPELIGGDGRLRASFRMAHVKSGRMSVERFQAQAIPKNDKDIDGLPGVRTLFHPKPGHELWNLDLSQAELRVAAKYSRCDPLLEMLAAGADIHGNTCKAIFGIGEDDPTWKSKRDIAKRLTFGSIFMIGPETFKETLKEQAGIQISLADATDAVYAWRDQYPQIERAYTKAKRLVDKRGWVRLLPGTEYERQSYFGAMDYTNTAWSRLVQGSLAEFVKMWLNSIERDYPGLLVMTVHDSAVLETPIGSESLVHQIAEQGGRWATEIFDIGMKIDVGPW